MSTPALLLAILLAAGVATPRPPQAGKTNAPAFTPIPPAAAPSWSAVAEIDKQLASVKRAQDELSRQRQDWQQLMALRYRGNPPLRSAEKAKLKQITAADKVLTERYHSLELARKQHEIRLHQLGVSKVPRPLVLQAPRPAATNAVKPKPAKAATPTPPAP